MAMPNLYIINENDPALESLIVISHISMLSVSVLIVNRFIYSKEAKKEQKIKEAR